AEKLSAHRFLNLRRAAPKVPETNFVEEAGDSKCVAGERGADSPIVGIRAQAEDPVRAENLRAVEITRPGRTVVAVGDVVPAGVRQRERGARTGIVGGTTGVAQ